MKDKQVILNKTEFDQMESELKDLRDIVNSRTICQIKTPRIGWGHAGSYIDSYHVEYIAGCDENEIVKELSEEIERQRNESIEWQNMFNIKCIEVSNAESKLQKFKDLPWYKKILVK